MPLTLAIADIDWLWAAAKWAGLVGGGVLLAWALFWDRARGRPRCPKCWYDMAGATPAGDGNAESDAGAPSRPFTCPECGKTVKRCAGLLRTRRHPWWAAAAVLLLVVGYAGSRQAVYQRERSFVAFIPTTVLVLTVDPQWWRDFQVARASGAMPLTWKQRGLAALDSRLYRSHGWQIDVFATRAENRLTNEASGEAIWRAHDVVDLIRTDTTKGDAAKESGRRIYPSRMPSGRMSSFAYFVTGTIEPQTWHRHAGSNGACTNAGYQLLVNAPSHTQHEISRFIDALRRAEDWPTSSAGWTLIDSSEVNRYIARFPVNTRHRNELNIATVLNGIQMPPREDLSHKSLNPDRSKRDNILDVAMTLKRTAADPSDINIGFIDSTLYVVASAAFLDQLVTATRIELSTEPPSP